MVDPTIVGYVIGVHQWGRELSRRDVIALTTEQ
jgi:hypothetical protein